MYFFIIGSGLWLRWLRLYPFISTMTTTPVMNIVGSSRPMTSPIIKLAFSTRIGLCLTGSNEPGRIMITLRQNWSRSNNGRRALIWLWRRHGTIQWRIFNIFKIFKIFSLPQFEWCLNFWIVRIPSTEVLRDSCPHTHKHIKFTFDLFHSILARTSKV